jgi:hypothetical protein
MTNCCDDYGNCDQGLECPVRVAKVGKRMHGPQPLQEGVWRYWVRRAAYWLLMAVLGLTVWPLLLFLVWR